ncbi:MAG: hypothetical protein KDB80_04855 [Planctomycetes bacterium]|nr:hypothetical protein [Planctomycetota bacterium]
MARSSVLAVLLACGPALSQEPSALGRDLVIPIHTPEPGSHGTWAGGESYKARLDDSFRFYPVLGSGYRRSLSLGWRTEWIGFGREPSRLVGEPVEVEVAPDRFERRWPGVVEAYDFLPDLVEQTFEIRRPPTVLGDLVVVGAVDTEFEAAPREAEHAPLRFEKDGKQLVEYGAATVVDANGIEFPMTTSFDGARIELRLPAASVDAATFPLLVDPAMFSLDPAREIGMTDVTFMPGEDMWPNFAMITRINSQTDHDAIGYNYDENGLTAILVSDLGLTDSQRVAVGTVADENRFVAAWEQRQGFHTDLRIWSDGPIFDAVTARNATLVGVSGEHFRNPDIGGVRPNDGSFAIVVYDHALLTTNHTVDALRFDPDTAAVTHLPDVATVADETRPAISPIAAQEWMVCWNDILGADHRVLARMILPNATLSASVETLRSRTNEIHTDVKVAGGRGTYLATWSSTPIGFGVRAIRTQRFTWGANESFELRQYRTLVSGTSGFRNEGLAHDHDSRSHWLVSYTKPVGTLGREIEVARLGWTGGMVETVQPQGSIVESSHASAVAFVTPFASSEEEHFTVSYAVDDSVNSAFTARYDYPAEVFAPTRYGADCGVTAFESSGPGKAGSHSFTVTLLAPVFAVSALTLGRQQASIPLDVIGMPRCELLVEPTTAVTIPGTPNGFGTATINVPLNDSPVLLGSLYTQWLYIDLGANALGVVANQGWEHHVQ